MFAIILQLCFLAALVGAQSTLNRAQCYNAQVTLLCGHGVTDPYAVDWIITGESDDNPVIRQFTGQDATIRPDYQDGELELDFASGNLTMTVQPGYNNSYVCRVRPLEFPPGYDDVATNILDIPCTALSGVDATLSNKPILKDGTSRWKTRSKRTLVCQATSDPPPSITVVKDGEDLPDAPECEPFNDVTKCTLTKELRDFDRKKYDMACRINFDPPMNITPMALIYPFRFVKEMSLGPLLACIIVPIAILTSVAVVTFVLYRKNRSTEETNDKNSSTPAQEGHEQTAVTDVSPIKPTKLTSVPLNDQHAPSSMYDIAMKGNKVLLGNKATNILEMMVDGAMSIWSMPLPGVPADCRKFLSQDDLIILQNGDITYISNGEMNGREMKTYKERGWAIAAVTRGIIHENYDESALIIRQADDPNQVHYLHKGGKDYSACDSLDKTRLAVTHRGVTEGEANMLHIYFNSGGSKEACQPIKLNYTPANDKAVGNVSKDHFCVIQNDAITIHLYDWQTCKHLDQWIASEDLGLQKEDYIEEIVTGEDGTLNVRVNNSNKIAIVRYNVKSVYDDASHGANRTTDL